MSEPNGVVAQFEKSVKKNETRDFMKSSVQIKL